MDGIIMACGMPGIMEGIPGGMPGITECIPGGMPGMNGILGGMPGSPGGGMPCHAGGGGGGGHFAVVDEDAVDRDASAVAERFRCNGRDDSAVAERCFCFFAAESSGSFWLAEMHCIAFLIALSTTAFVGPLTCTLRSRVRTRQPYFSLKSFASAHVSLPVPSPGKSFTSTTSGIFGAMPKAMGRCPILKTHNIATSCKGASCKGAMPKPNGRSLMNAQ
jgi:hypothetical protein